MFNIYIRYLFLVPRTSCNGMIIWFDNSILILLIGLTLSHYCACSRLGSGFSTSHIVIFFVTKCLWGDDVHGLVDIGGVIDHSCIIIFMIINYMHTVKGLIKTWISNLVRTARFCNHLHLVRSISKFWKVKWLRVGAIKPKVIDIITG